LCAHFRMWPRALLTPFTDQVDLTDRDRRAYQMYAPTQRYKGLERVGAKFSAAPTPPRQLSDTDHAVTGARGPSTDWPRAVING
jgi:hypothetical protein